MCICRCGSCCGCGLTITFAQLLQDISCWEHLRGIPCHEGAGSEIPRTMLLLLYLMFIHWFVIFAWYCVLNFLCYSVQSRSLYVIERKSYIGVFNCNFFFSNHGHTPAREPRVSVHSQKPNHGREPIKSRF